MRARSPQVTGLLCLMLCVSSVGSSTSALALTRGIGDKGLNLGRVGLGPLLTGAASRLVSALRPAAARLGGIVSSSDDLVSASVMENHSLRIELCPLLECGISAGMRLSEIVPKRARQSCPHRLISFVCRELVISTNRRSVSTVTKIVGVRLDWIRCFLRAVTIVQEIGWMSRKPTTISKRQTSATVRVNSKGQEV